MKTKYLIKMSLDKKFKSKWFKIVNILLLVVIALIVNIDNIINFFGGDFNEKTNIHIIDNTNYTYELITENIKNTVNSTNNNEEDDMNYNVELSTKSKEELTKNLKDDVIIIVNDSDKNYVEYEIISQGYMSTLDYQIITTALNSTKVQIALSKSNINPEELNDIYKEAEIKRTYLNENKKSEEESMSMIMSTVFPVIILPFFMLTIFLVQMIGAEINDEKTTKGMEIIISSVSPKQHFFSKVIASNVFVIVQGLLLIGFVGIGLLIRTCISGDSVMTLVKDFVGSAITDDFVSKLGYVIPLSLILMVVTFLGYSLVAGILSSVTTTPEDFQQIQTPIMIVLLIGYYLAIMASTFEGSIFIKLMSYIPFISAILAPSLLVLGQISIMGMVISIIIMLLINFILIKYGLRIYKVGILNYSSKDLWKKIFKSIKKNS